MVSVQYIVIGLKYNQNVEKGGMMRNLKDKFIQLSPLSKTIFIFVALSIITLVAILILSLMSPQTSDDTGANDANSATESPDEQTDEDTVKDTRPQIIGIENMTYRGVKTRTTDDIKSVLINYYDNTDDNQHGAEKVEISNNIMYSKTIEATQNYISNITIDDEIQKQVTFVISDKGDGNLLRVIIADTDGNNAEVIYGSLLNN